MHYLCQLYSNSFPNIKFNDTSTKEIELSVPYNQKVHMDMMKSQLKY